MDKAKARNSRVNGEWCSVPGSEFMVNAALRMCGSLGAGAGTQSASNSAKWATSLEAAVAVVICPDNIQLQYDFKK